MRSFKPAAAVLARIALVSLLAPACASVPAFTPSRPLEEAPSLQEGLLLCAEYRVPAAPPRPVAVRPFLDCVEALRERFPGAGASQERFKAFHGDLRLLWDLLNDQNWSEELGAQVDIAVHAALRGLWQLDPPVVTPVEKQFLLQTFPGASRRMRAHEWPVSADAGMDPKLEALKAGFAALTLGDEGLEDAAGRKDAQVAPRAASLCEGYRHLRAEVRYLSELNRDQHDFARLAPRDPLSAAVRDKYARRLDAATRELRELRPQVASARIHGGFRVLACGPHA